MKSGKRIALVLATIGVAATLVSTSVVASAGAAAAPAAGPTISSVSVRGDLVSGGEDLLEVTLPPGTAPSGAVLRVDGAPITDQLHPAPPGSIFPAPASPIYLWSVRGLENGAHTASVTVGGQTAQLPLTSHPWGAPAFSGPQALPWQCTTVQAGLGPPLDSYCNARAQVSYYYMPAGLVGADTPDTGLVFPVGQFKPYDPALPPSPGSIATITTDSGQQVPYIVRYERGTVNRGLYDMAILAQPGQSYAPWSPPSGWDHKATYMFGGGCGLNYSQGDYGQNTGTATGTPALDDWSLSRGRAVLFSTMSTTGENCQTVTGAETVMELKQRLADEFGPIRFTTSLGCSGGSIMPTQVADAYPGLIDGVLPHCSYSDLFNPLLFGVMDCSVLENYFNHSPTKYTVEQRAAVEGEIPGDTNCSGEENGTAFPSYSPSGNCAGTQSYSTVNPTGVRCDLYDRFANQLGRDSTGAVNLPADNVGVQYGLRALAAGTITVDEFLDLNQKAGGLDTNGQFQAARTVGSDAGIRRMYQNDLLMSGTRLGDIPDIDARSDWQLDMHDNSQWAFTRNRLLKANGNANNQIHWFDTTTKEFGMPPAATESASLDLLDQWLDAITSDARGFSSPAAKATADKPQAVQDTCFVSGQAIAWTAGSVCNTDFSFAGDARVAAAGPATNDVIKCQLKPLNRADYTVTMTDAQWASLQQIFPSGVCDYTKPGIGQQAPTGSWLSYQNGPDGQPLGAAPRSTIVNK